MTKIISNSMYGDKFCATVTSMDSDSFVVSNEYASFKAKKGVSCLVEPKISDEVLLYKADEENIYITDVLARHDISPIEIIAKDGISIKAKNITLNANESLNSFADEANIVISKVNFLTKIATLKSETLNVIASMYQGAIDNLHMKSESVTRHVNGHEELQCNSSRKIVKESDVYNVNDSITIAGWQVKIDADQINMG
ncbi:MAG: DUF3540 domain-containing protein [Sulfurimonas sp.]|nr:DUF3540 domain-containing protein [Sulfurimonas sp.]